MIDITAAPYNADRTGAVDATDAIKSAIAQHRGETIFFPHGTYSVRAGEIGCWTVKLQGEYSDTQKYTRIVATTTGGCVLWSAAFCQLQDIVIDGAGLTEYGIALTAAHGSRFVNVGVGGATVAAWWLNGAAHCLLEQCVASGSPVGFQLDGCNGTKLVRCMSTNCGTGLVGLGKWHTSALAAGCFSVDGFTAQSCGAGVVIRGCEAATVRDLFAEGCTSDAVRLTDTCRTVLIEQVRASGGGAQAFHVAPGCVATTLEKCCADGSGTFARILDQGNSTTVVACYRIGGALTPLPVVTS